MSFKILDPDNPDWTMEDLDGDLNDHSSSFDAACESAGVSLSQLGYSVAEEGNHQFEGLCDLDDQIESYFEDLFEED